MPLLTSNLNTDGQTVTAILCSLLRRIVVSSGNIPHRVQSIYNDLPEDRKDNDLSNEQCIAILRNLNGPASGRWFVIFDPLQPV